MPFGNGKKNILQDLFSLVSSQFKKYHPSGNIKLKNLGNFKSLTWRNFMGKILRISLKLNFTPNTLGCFGLIDCFVFKNKHIMLFISFNFIPKTGMGLPKTGIIFYCVVFSL